MRQPLKLHFKPPASPGRWRLTGRFNQPRPSYGVMPNCEWINDEDGDQIWLSPSLIPIRENPLALTLGPVAKHWGLDP